MILTQQLILGLLVGGLYGLAAAGLSLTFGVLRVLNVAHGELLMLGGYGTFWLFTLWKIDPFVSLLAVAPAMFVLGLCLYWALFQFIVKADEETRIKNSLLIGFGLTLVLHALAIRLWTADERAVTTAYAGAVLRLGGLAVPWLRLSSLVFAFAILTALHLFLAKARWGRAIRATAEDWEAAALMGIPVGKTYLLAFALGTALAGIAGGLVTLGTRPLWVGGTPLVLALIPGALVAMLFGLLIGVPAFRLRVAYFAIGTLGLAEILRITIGNLLPQISTIPAAELTSYNILPRYYLTLTMAMVSVGVVAWLVPSRLGLGIRAVREDEAAAEATGVSALRHKLLALALSTALAGLAGGAFAYYHVSYYPQHTFSPAWTFDAVLMAYIGGVGTVHGPVLGALFYVILKELLAVKLVEFHLIIFGILFMLVVLFLPGGLVEAWSRVRRLISRNG